jgi:hypothetical protein
MDKAQSVTDFELYSSNKLQELELFRSSFVISPSISAQFPVLERIRFSFGSRMDPVQVALLSSRLPLLLKEFCVEVPGPLVNQLLSSIAERLLTPPPSHICCNIFYFPALYCGP